VDVDLLIAQLDREERDPGGAPLLEVGDFETERAVERDHLLRPGGGQRDVVEARNGQGTS
jgi:hypothetical protein